MKATKDVDVLIFALARWDGKYSSTAISIARELSKTNRVFYIDNPFTIKDFIVRFFTQQIQKRLWALLLGLKKYRLIDSGNNNLINATPALVLPINFLNPGFWYSLFSRYNEYRVKQIVKRIQHDHNVADFVFINCFNPFYFAEPEHLAARASIYYCFDNISKSLYVYKHGERREREAFSRYDITLTTSRHLLTIARNYSNNAYCLPNAADFDLFYNGSLSVPARPKDLPSGTIIGYVGHIDVRIDYAILRALAEQHSDKFIVLVGPISGTMMEKHVHGFPNVITTGPRKLHELPAYIAHFHCAIIPFLCNELTECIYPLKLNEYLSCGKPIVTTRFSKDIEDFEKVISVVDSTEEFVNQVAIVIHTNTPEKVDERIAVARNNTWANRVDRFWEILEENNIFTNKA